MAFTGERIGERIGTNIVLLAEKGTSMYIQVLNPFSPHLARAKALLGFVLLVPGSFI